MKPPSHKAFAKHVARLVCTTELTRRGIQFDSEEQLLADKTIIRPGNNPPKLPAIPRPGPMSIIKASSPARAFSDI
jgi:hypothetical protein